MSYINDFPSEPEQSKSQSTRDSEYQLKSQTRGSSQFDGLIMGQGASTEVEPMFYESESVYHEYSEGDSNRSKKKQGLSIDPDIDSILSDVESFFSENKSEESENKQDASIESMLSNAESMFPEGNSVYSEY